MLLAQNRAWLLQGNHARLLARAGLPDTNDALGFFERSIS
jgi:hypothetical protein